MRIASICRVVPAHTVGGMPEAVWESALALKQAGHDVELLTTSLPDFVGVRCVQGINIHFLPGTTAQGYDGFFEAARAAYDQLNKEKPFQMVLAHSKVARDFLRPRNHRVRVPVILVNHGNSLDQVQTHANEYVLGLGDITKATGDLQYSYDGKDPYWGISDYAIYQAHDAIVAHTPVAVSDLEYRYHCNKVACVPNPCQPAAPGLSGSKDGPLVACAASFVPIKGLAAILYAFKHSGCRLKVIGDVPSARLPSWAVAVGRVPPQDVMKHMDKCSIFIDGSYHYSCCNLTLAHACSMGIPLLALNVPGGAFAVGEGTERCGFTVPITQPVQWATCRESILERYEMFSERAIMRWKKWFHPDVYVDRLLSLAQRAGCV